jgi:DUF2934 family protein
MARTKSTSSGKNNRTTTDNNNNKEQTGNSHPANIPDVKVVHTVSAEAAPAEVAPEAKVKVKPEPRKLGIVKTEPRKNGSVNLVPINLEEEIRRRAYELYQQRGPASGSEAEDWLTAEREVRQRYRQQQSA